MGYNEHKEDSPQSVSCAVITVSDSRTPQTDESGDIIAEALMSKGHSLAYRTWLGNNLPALQAELGQILETDMANAVIITGGTGLSHRDITIEAVTPILDKVAHGFGELFRWFSYQDIATGCILSRALAGVARGRVIICLPGSSAAVRMAMDKIIIPELGHMVREASR